VSKKEKHCDRDDPDDDRCGDCWDYVALDPEHRSAGTRRGTSICWSRTSTGALKAG
jgi:hypothetical protein